jgi:hypothetical protein
MISAAELADFAACVMLGASRCSSIAQLNDYYLRHKAEIEADPRRDEIVRGFAKRKGELSK